MRMNIIVELLNKENTEGRITKEVNGLNVGYRMAEVSDGKLKSFPITEKNIAMMPLGYGDIYAEALRNTQRLLPAKTITMADYFGVDDSTKNIWILTNAAERYGASVILYKNLLSKMRQVVGGDFYIMPSSIHEVLIVPAEDACRKDLEAMVMAVNAEAVTPEERLGERVILYAEE